MTLAQRLLAFVERPAPALLALLLGACGSGAPEQAAQPQLPIEAAAPEPACQAKIFEGSSFTICPFHAGQDRIELIDGSGLRSLPALERSLGARAAEVRFAMNAGMYDEQGRPIGLFVANGRERKPLNLGSGSGNFHLLPNGVFAVDAKGRVSVTPSTRFRKHMPKPVWATQSGPMLVIDGKLHPKFDSDGPSQLVRNGVGVRDPDHAFFAISEDPVSFGRFARLFRDALACPNALYLDGTVSSLWDRPAGRQDRYSNLGPMLVVSRPSSAGPSSR